MKFLGIDPITQAIPIRPVAHYSMGGIEADIDGRTKVENVWAAGEVACHSMHGANRLGCNSTAECLVWGGITGREISKYLEPGVKLDAAPGSGAREEEKRIFDGLLQQNGTENPAHIRRELRTLMDRHAGVYRTGESIQEGLDKIAELRRRFRNIAVRDKSRIYNTNLIQNVGDREHARAGRGSALRRSGAPGIPRSAFPHGFPGARRRKVPGPLDGLLDRRHAEAGIEAGRNHHLEAGGAKVLIQGGRHGRNQKAR
jgi:succinate dehydrogenase/fumarate reductase flavoprotein subunit